MSKGQLENLSLIETLFSSIKSYSQVDRSGVHQAGNWGYCDRGAAEGDCPLPGPNPGSRTEAITVPQLITNRAQAAKNSEEECTGVRLPFHWEENLDIDLIAATKVKKLQIKLNHRN